MGHVDDYHLALLAALPAVDDSELESAIARGGSSFVSFVVDHGLGPVWHARTNFDGFAESRMAAEALYAAQKATLIEVDQVLGEAGIQYAVVKGAATRELLYPNPALRACFDIDILVSHAQRVTTAKLLVQHGFNASLDPNNVSWQMTLSRGVVDIDLHWNVLRDGRLRREVTDGMLARRCRSDDFFALHAGDALFLLLTHPAISKHLDGWGVGLHRVVDILQFADTQDYDWNEVSRQLTDCGVRSAAWATLTWCQLLARDSAPARTRSMQDDLRPGLARRTWLSNWLRRDLSTRLAGWRILRLGLFSSFLHDEFGDTTRAIAARRRAHERQSEDLAAFASIDVE